MACSESCKAKAKTGIAVGCGKLIGAAIVYVPIIVCLHVMCDSGKAHCPELEDRSTSEELTSAEEIELKECKEEQPSKVFLH